MKLEVMHIRTSNGQHSKRIYFVNKEHNTVVNSGVLISFKIAKIAQFTLEKCTFYHNAIIQDIFDG